MNYSSTNNQKNLEAMTAEDYAYYLAHGYSEKEELVTNSNKYERLS